MIAMEFPNAVLPTADVLFEDHHLLVLNKPAGLPTQAPPAFPSLEAVAKAYIKEKYAKPAGVYLGIPHRLDRPVTGIVVFCRNSKAAARVHAQFQNRSVSKIYWGLVSGSGIVDDEWRDSIRKIPDKAKAEIAEPSAPDAKEAITGIRVLRSFEGTTLLELAPKTGRMHQLRIQAASRGYPIIGDELYGSKTPFTEAGTIALHARRLSFEHPFRKETLTIEVAPPALWPTWVTEQS
jgi:23S rRNA pseudouridine1911/1915/1917 synthase